MYKLAVFDLDGTILNTLDDLSTSMNYALRQNGYGEYTAEEYKKIIGHGPVHLAKMALPLDCRGEAYVKELLRVFSEYYSLHDHDLTSPYPGVPEALEKLKMAGVAVAVYSNKPHKNVVNLCKQYFDGLIDFSVGYQEGIPPKPDAYQGIKIMERFGAGCEETVYTGDSGVDMLTGKALGVYTIGVSWGFRSRKELEDSGASIIIDDTSSLVKIILDR